ncbi:MAG: hypothetical protein K6E37_03290 [Bacteroidales bacterium]|nr:hypothetical protein [Bacteroidales bacterium]
MKTRAIYLLAAAALLAGCTREMITPEGAPEGVKTVLEIGLPDTKTTLGDKVGSNRKVYWSDGDCIAVNGVTSDPLSGVPAQSTSALFSFTGNLTAPYSIAYPASIWKDATTVTLPATQTYVSGTFANDALPMIGYASTGSSPSLSHVCAVVKASLVLSSGESIDKDKIESITFKGNSSEQISGDFTVDYQNAALTSKSAGAGDNAVTIALGKTLSTENPLEVYIVVPAGNYASGFSLTITDVNGHYMKKSNGGAVDLQAGHIYVLPDLAFEPTGEEVTVDIASANDLVAFASDFNDGKFFGSKLRVNVVSNISFDSNTSQAFSATGGIGCKTADGDNYFNGSFDGGGHSISNYSGSCPLFGYTGSGASVKDLTVSSNCAYTFTHPNAEDYYMAAVVGYNRGVIENVNVQATLTVADGSVDYAACLGGVAGRVVVGKVNNCSFSGAIVLGSGFASNAKAVYVGGIAGLISNAAGVVQDCSFGGTIDFAARAISSDKKSPTLFIGGIVGRNNLGTVSGCTTKSSPYLPVTIKEESYAGTIRNTTTQSYHMAEGGIVGMNSGSVISCENSAEILNFVLTTGTDNTAADDNSRYMYIGGVVGYNIEGGSVAQCSNKGAVIECSTPRHQKVGGVVGYNNGEVDGCDNTAKMTVATAGIGPYGVRLLRLGGVIGEHNGSAAIVKSVVNYGDLLITRIENNANTDTAIGGVIGLATGGAVIDSASNIQNNGNIAFNNDMTTNVSAAGYSVGGVVGHSGVSLSGLTNNGEVVYAVGGNAGPLSNLWLGGVVGYVSDDATELSNNTNNGEVNFQVNKNIAHTNNIIGGVAGHVAVPVQVNGCTNTGKIHGGNTSKNNGKSLILGGIIGYLAGNSQVTYCSNNGVLRNDQFNNSEGDTNSTYEGGIVGYCAGEQSASIQITGCTNVALPYVTENFSGTGPRRGYCGGIAGYANYTSISSCTTSGDYTGSSFYNCGGIAGWIINSSVSGCSYTGTAMASSQIKVAGGIVGVLDAGSSINNCNSNLTTVTAGANELVFGGIAGKSVKATETAPGTSISGCHYKSSIAICSDDNFTDGGGNAADL